MFHLHGGLVRAASAMNTAHQKDFLNFVNTETEICSPYSIFILKKKNLMSCVPLYLLGFIIVKIFLILINYKDMVKYVCLITLQKDIFPIG